MRIGARLLTLAAFLVLPVTLAAQRLPLGTAPYTLEGVAAEDQAGAREAGCR